METKVTNLESGDSMVRITNVQDGKLPLPKYTFYYVNTVAKLAELQEKKYKAIENGESVETIDADIVKFSTPILTNPQP